MRTHPCTPARTGWESLFVRQRRAMTRWSRTNLPAAGSWLAFSVLQVHFDPIPQPSLWKRKIRHTHTIATLMARLLSFSPWIVFSCRRRRRCCCCCFVHTTIGIVVVTDCSFRPCHHPPNECRAQRWQQQQQQKQLKFLRFEHDRFIFLCYILLSCNIINRCYLSCRKVSFVKLSIFFSLVVGVVVVPAGHMPKTLLPFMSTEEEKKKLFKAAICLSFALHPKNRFSERDPPTAPYPVGFFFFRCAAVVVFRSGQWTTRRILFRSPFLSTTAQHSTAQHSTQLAYWWSISIESFRLSTPIYSQQHTNRAPTIFLPPTVHCYLCFYFSFYQSWCTL